jgi:hypothetical protein
MTAEYSTVIFNYFKKNIYFNTKITRKPRISALLLRFRGHIDRRIFQNFSQKIRPIDPQFYRKRLCLPKYFVD